MAQAEAPNAAQYQIGSASYLLRAGRRRSALTAATGTGSTAALAGAYQAKVARQPEQGRSKDEQADEILHEQWHYSTPGQMRLPT